MNYVAHWTDVALDELAAVWTAAADQNAARPLRTDSSGISPPTRTGAAFYGSRPPTTPRLSSPSGIEYDVIEDDKTVRVLRVWSLV